MTTHHVTLTVTVETTEGADRPKSFVPALEGSETLPVNVGLGLLHAGLQILHDHVESGDIDGEDYLSTSETDSQTFRIQ